MTLRQHASEKRSHRVFIKTRDIGTAQPTPEGLAETRQLPEVDPAEGSFDERALPRTTHRKVPGFELAVGLKDGIRIDRKGRHNIPDGRQLVTNVKVAKSQRMLNLLHQL